MTVFTIGVRKIVRKELNVILDLTVKTEINTNGIIQGFSALENTCTIESSCNEEHSLIN